MKNDFYVALEERFRGSRELISARLQVYLPFVEPLKEIYPAPPTIDLGCGRGEWLEILGERGFQAQGVDLNDGMLSACRDLGLKVQTGDALSFLKKLPDESQVIVSAFHLVEHIPFEDLQEIVKESLRVLKPAGLLILETPNPENIIVGTSSFYMDPTHTSPIPPDLLTFLPEYYGFHRVEVLRLQESIEVLNNSNLSLLSVLNGVSPDYAVVAQKNALKELLEMNIGAFNTEYGVTLEALATTYNQQAEARAEHAETRAEHAETRAHQYHAELQSVYASRSWYITLPLRKMTSLFKKLASTIFRQMIRTKQLTKQTVRWALMKPIEFALANPRLKALASQHLRKHTRIKEALRSIAIKDGYENVPQKRQSFDTLESVTIMKDIELIYADKEHTSNIIYLGTNNEK